MSTSTTHTGADAVSNLSNLLPTGTFLAFQTLAPLFTNDGDCAGVEKIMTGLLIGMFEFICFFSNFTDSITTSSGKVYYGVVTSKGLFNPQFQDSGLQEVEGMVYKDSTGRYLLNIFDLVNGILNVVTFSALSLLTAPITTCFYPGISSTIIKTVPILVGMVVGMYFAFAPHSRQGIGFALNTGKVGLVSDNQTPITTLTSSKKLGDRALLLGKDGNNSNRDIALHVRNAQENPTFEPSPTHSMTPASTPLHRSPNRGT